jgi:hypothetical protein
VIGNTRYRPFRQPIVTRAPAILPHSKLEEALPRLRRLPCGKAGLTERALSSSAAAPPAPDHLRQPPLVATEIPLLKVYQDQPPLVRLRGVRVKASGPGQFALRIRVSL